MVFVADNDSMPGSGADTGQELDSTPQSQEAEAALLGVLLYDNEVYHKISPIVQSKHFYNHIWRFCWIMPRPLQPRLNIRSLFLTSPCGVN